MIIELQETKLNLEVYIQENHRLLEELGESKFKMLSMGNFDENKKKPTTQLEVENYELKEEIFRLKEELNNAKEIEEKLREREEEVKNLESAKRNMIGSFGSIGSNHRDSTGYMLLKNPNSETKVHSKIIYFIIIFFILIIKLIQVLLHHFIFHNFWILLIYELIYFPLHLKSLFHFIEE